MKNSKKLIISFMISLVVVLIFQFIWNSFLNYEEETIYVLTKDVYKGEKITEEDIESIKISSREDMKDSFNVDYVNKVAKENLAEGKILESTDLQYKEKMEETEEKYEYVSIEVKDISDAVAYQLSKGDNINVYFTARDISDTSNTNSIIQNTKTIKILDNKKIIGLYDTSGNEVLKENVYNAIMLRVTTEEAMNLSNIKEEGKFNISLVK